MAEMGEMKRQEEMYQSPVSAETLVFESMDIGAVLGSPALPHSFSFSELQQQALDLGVQWKNATRATSKEELREMINQIPPKSSPVSRLSSACLLPSMRRRPRDKVDLAEQPQQKSNSTSAATTRDQEKNFLAIRRENSEKLAGRLQRSRGADQVEQWGQGAHTSRGYATDRQTTELAAHLHAMEQRHTEYISGKIVNCMLHRQLAAAFESWQHHVKTKPLARDC